MRLPDFTADPGLIALRRLMGADAPGSFSPSYRPDKLTLAELEQLATRGKDVSIDDVVVLEDGTLSYKDSRVIVYIRDVISWVDSTTIPASMWQTAQLYRKCAR
jgi:hypothetical protein